MKTKLYTRSGSVLASYLDEVDDDEMFDTTVPRMIISEDKVRSDESSESHSNFPTAKELPTNPPSPTDSNFNVLSGVFLLFAMLMAAWYGHHHHHTLLDSFFLQSIVVVVVVVVII